MCEKLSKKQINIMHYILNRKLYESNQSRRKINQMSNEAKKKKKEKIINL